MAKNFGRMIYAARSAQRLSLRRLGEVIGASAGNLSEIERGERLPPKDDGMLHKIASALGLDFGSLKEAAQFDRLALGKNSLTDLVGGDLELAAALFREASKGDEDARRRAFTRALEELQRGES